MLRCSNVSIQYKNNEPILEGFNLQLSDGETVLLVGKTGVGKTSLVNAMLGLLEKEKAKVGGNIVLNNVEVDQNNHRQMRMLRKTFVSMMPQDAKAALNPTKKVGKQISLFVRERFHISKKQCKKIALEHLSKAGFDNARKIYNSYPHQLSAGMAQRCLFVQTIITKPQLLILDEPTSSVDHKAATGLLHLVKDYQTETNCGLIIITHNLNFIKTVFNLAKTLEIGDKSA